MLEVTDLSVDYLVEGAPISVLRGLSLRVAGGEAVGLLGSSGAGKTTLARALLRILPAGASIRSGAIRFGGRDLLSLAEREMRALRGGKMAIVFQEPSSALNPLMKIGDQISEGIRAHFPLDRRRARRRAEEWLSWVGLDRASACLDAYPHQLSGGQRQRVLLAGALACEPELLICDEPTSSVDSMTRIQILDRLANLRRRCSFSLVLISHDLDTVWFLADRVLELREGRVVPGSTPVNGNDGGWRA